MSPRRASPTTEWLLIAAATFVGAVLRFWSFGRLSLSHFDEGIYAFSGLWIANDSGPTGLDPMIIAYAPPVFPILVGLSSLLFGIGDHAAILAATLCGVATILAVGWLGRRSFGPGAGAASASFAATSLAHIAFSLKAMTDAPFLLAWVIAVGLGSRFLERPGPGRAIALGLAVGLAQNVKYNGWLVGGLVVLAAVAASLPRPGERHPVPLLPTFGWGLGAALVAGLVYTPWFSFVEAHGGYAALLRHHRSYLGGVGSWWSHWRTQLGEASALSGSAYWRGGTWLLASLAASATGDRAGFRSRADRRGVLRSLGLVGLGASVFAFQANLGWWLGLGWFAWLLLEKSPAHRMLGAWWLILSIMTPFYHPYARLWLPIHAFGWIILGGLAANVGWVPGEGEAVDDSPWSLCRRLIPGVSALLCLILSFVQLGLDRPRPLDARTTSAPDDRESLRSFVFDDLAPGRFPEAESFRVLARRPLAYYLALQGRHPFRIEPGLDRLLEPARAGDWAIVDEAMLLQEGSRDASLARILQQWTIRGTFPTRVDPVTLLDIEPHAAFQRNPRRSLQLWVLSPRPSPGSP